jgi:hypothetical protein
MSQRLGAICSSEKLFLKRRRKDRPHEQATRWGDSGGKKPAPTSGTLARGRKRGCSYSIALFDINDRDGQRAVVGGRSRLRRIYAERLAISAAASTVSSWLFVRIMKLPFA